jgi:hypothetical protein
MVWKVYRRVKEGRIGPSVKVFGTRRGVENVSGRGSRGRKMKMKGVKGGANCMGTRKNQEGVDGMRKRKPGQVVGRMKMSLVGTNAGRMMGSTKARIEEIGDGGEGKRRKQLPKLRGWPQKIGALDATVVVQGVVETRMIEARNANMMMTPPSNTGPTDQEDEMRSTRSNDQDGIDATTRILLVLHHPAHVGKRRTTNRAEPPGGVGERSMTLSRDSNDDLPRMELEKRASHHIDVIHLHLPRREKRGNAMTTAHEINGPKIVIVTRDVDADPPREK